MEVICFVTLADGIRLGQSATLLAEDSYLDLDLALCQIRSLVVIPEMPF